MLANRCRNLAILKTTFGRFINVLCDMSNLWSDAKSANSSGSVDILLCDKFKSVIRKCKIILFEFFNWFESLLKCLLTYTPRKTRPKIILKKKNSPVIKLNLTANFGGILVKSFVLKLQVFNSVCLIK